MSEIKIVNCLSGEETVREMNKTELAQLTKDQIAAETLAEAKAVKAEAKASALAKLGLTADEAAALFG